MAARLPTPGGDAGNWGKILNDYLRVEHNSDGSLKNVARPSDLNSKADASDLGTAANMDVEVFATAEQGAKADSSIQPSSEIAEAVDFRHQHSNKTLLDSVTPEALIPTGGSQGQALVVGTSGTEWQTDYARPVYHGGYVRPTTVSHGMTGGFIAKDLVANRLYFVPFMPPVTGVYESLHFVITSPSATGEIKIGIFDNDGIERGFSLVQTVGTLSTTGSFAQIDGISVLGRAGRAAWIGLLASEAFGIRAANVVGSLGSYTISQSLPQIPRHDVPYGDFPPMIIPGYTSQDPNPVPVIRLSLGAPVF